MPKASSHFLLTYGTNYQIISVECLLLLTYLQYTLWFASQSQDIFRDIGIWVTVLSSALLPESPEQKLGYSLSQHTARSGPSVILPCLS